MSGMSTQAWTFLGIVAGASIPASLKIFATYVGRKATRKADAAHITVDLADASLKKAQADDLVTETARKVVELTKDTFDALREQVAHLEQELALQTTRLNEERSRCDLLQETIQNQQAILENQAKEITQMQKIIEHYHQKDDIIVSGA